MIDGFFMTGQKKSEGVFMSTQVSPSIVDQGTVALAVSSVLPTITVCLMPLAFVNTVEYIPSSGKSEGTISSLGCHSVSSAFLAQK